MIFISVKTERGQKKPTSFQAFPSASRGYTGAFGFAKAILLETATSFGCKRNTVSAVAVIDESGNRCVRAVSLISGHYYSHLRVRPWTTQRKSLVADWWAGAWEHLSRTRRNLMSNLRVDTEDWNKKKRLESRSARSSQGLFERWLELTDLYRCWAYQRACWVRSMRTMARGHAATNERVSYHMNWSHNDAENLEFIFKSRHPKFNIQMTWGSKEKSCVYVHMYLKSEGENTPIQSPSLGWG
jgi:hypothetical protein